MATKSFHVSGKQLVKKVKEIVQEGNVRNVRILHKKRTLVEIPLTAGAGIAAVTLLAAPVIAILVTLATILTDCTIEVEKTEDEEEPPSSP
ncbi:MAG: DUF4342 domain-containing protein [Dehalococcoidia bacterium]|nr:DUF4342 domain-containing protein [Dehalococcoidia bacterium]